VTGAQDDRRPYLTNGRFDVTKWRARLEELGSAITDGIIVGDGILDEPSSQRWGPSSDAPE
jgi:hypothetical protein